MTQYQTQVWNGAICPDAEAVLKGARDSWLQSVLSQEEERVRADAQLTFFFSIFIQSGTPEHCTVPPTFSVGLSSVKSL